MILLSLQVDKVKMKQGSRVSLDMTTLTIMRQLPREVDPLVYNMSIEDPGDVGYSSVGGLSEQIRELRKVGRPSSIVDPFLSDDDMCLTWYTNHSHIYSPFTHTHAHVHILCTIHSMHCRK